jgi:hypothetical protein
MFWLHYCCKCATSYCVQSPLQLRKWKVTTTAEATWIQSHSLVQKQKDLTKSRPHPPWWLPRRCSARCICCCCRGAARGMCRSATRRTPPSSHSLQSEGREGKITINGWLLPTKGGEISMQSGRSVVWLSSVCMKIGLTRSQEECHEQQGDADCWRWPLRSSSHCLEEETF